MFPSKNMKISDEGFNCPNKTPSKIGWQVGQSVRKIELRAKNKINIYEICFFELL